jgi:hypothetical protein
MNSVIIFRQIIGLPTISVLIATIGFAQSVQKVATVKVDNRFIRLSASDSSGNELWHRDFRCIVLSMCLHSGSFWSSEKSFSRGAAV